MIFSMLFFLNDVEDMLIELFFEIWFRLNVWFFEIRLFVVLLFDRIPIFLLVKFV